MYMKMTLCVCVAASISRNQKKKPVLSLSSHTSSTASRASVSCNRWRATFSNCSQRAKSANACAEAEENIITS